MNFLVIISLISLTESDIVQKIRQEISCDDCDIKVLSYHLPFGKKIEEFDSVEIISKDTKAYGRKIFTAYFAKEGKNFIGTIFAYVDKMVQVLVPTRRVERNEKLSFSDLEIKFVPLTLVPKDFLSPDEISGREISLKVPVAKGEILRRAHIADELVIRKGDKVKLVLENPKFYIEFPAIALSDAKSGEEIKVRNLNSNKVVYGRAKEGRIVIVNSFD
ncbi:MAG: flagellar basal body P-ring formation chaperone FlgA [Candidatus Calescibacterium sp.]|nr:flagellar basal body P-ring formation chaperone FlgA [Candidatus Calescibacterium sp.]MCX7733971.1 flagellar basal body P-ring formation chaperone FlgA [bacterium]MDW8086430.1 flagellar basal body P-ring formation chaperone FlgA [Candidatus Calescibacterium sp.]